MKKILSILLAAAMMFALLAGCGPKDQQEEKPPVDTGKVEDIVQENQGNIAEDVTKVEDVAKTLEKITQLDSAPTNLDPTAMNNSGMLFLWHVYEMPYHLTEFGGELTPVLADGTKGNYKPGMDHEAGSNEYILYICEGIKDHKGNELKASDVEIGRAHV